MIINFIENYKFHTRLTLNEQNLEVVDKRIILGTIIENNLSWNENFKALMKKKSEYQNAAALKDLEFRLQQRRNGKTVGDFLCTGPILSRLA